MEGGRAAGQGWRRGPQHLAVEPVDHEPQRVGERPVARRCRRVGDLVPAEGALVDPERGEGEGPRVVRVGPGDGRRGGGGVVEVEQVLEEGERVAGIAGEVAVDPGERRGCRRDDLGLAEAELGEQVPDEQRGAAIDGVVAVVVRGVVDVVAARAVEPEPRGAVVGPQLQFGEAVDVEEPGAEEARQALALAPLVAALEPPGVLVQHEDLGDLGDHQVAEVDRIVGVAGPARVQPDRRGAGAAEPVRTVAAGGDLHLHPGHPGGAEPAGHQAVVRFAGLHDGVQAGRLGPAGLLRLSL